MLPHWRTVSDSQLSPATWVIPQEIIEGKTAFVCKPCDSLDLAKAWEHILEVMFLGLGSYRQEIMECACAEHKWDAVARLTREAYEQIVRRKPSLSH